MTSPHHPDSDQIEQREERWLAERLAALDHAAPPVTVAHLRARAMRPVRSWPRLAAGIALAVGVAGVAYAAPGSPLPAVVRQVVALLRDEDRGPHRSSTADSATGSQAGIAVTPGEHFTIEFPGNMSGGSARVDLTDGTEIVVRALNGASFISEASRLLIRTGTGARFTIEIPRDAPSVEIRVGGRPVFTKKASGITAPAAPAADGSYAIEL